MIIRLGTGIAEIIPFRRYDKPTLTKQQEDKGFITKKILTIMGIVAVAKVAVFLLWPI